MAEAFRLNSGGVNDASALDGWTAQQGPAPRTGADVGYQVQPHQLPDPGVAESAGIPPQPIPATIVVGGEEGLQAYNDGEVVEGPERVSAHTGESITPDLYR